MSRAPDDPVTFADLESAVRDLVSLNLRMAAFIADGVTGSPTHPVALKSLEQQIKEISTRFNLDGLDLGERMPADD